MIKITEHNVETGEITERDATAEELAQYELDAQELADRLAQIEANAIAKAALLDRLGITEDEAKLLLS